MTTDNITTDPQATDAEQQSTVEVFTPTNAVLYTGDNADVNYIYNSALGGADDRYKFDGSLVTGFRYEPEPPHIQDTSLASGSWRRTLTDPQVVVNDMTGQRGVIAADGKTVIY